MVGREGIEGETTGSMTGEGEGDRVVRETDCELSTEGEDRGSERSGGGEEKEVESKLSERRKTRKKVVIVDPFIEHTNL